MHICTVFCFFPIHSLIYLVVSLMHMLLLQIMLPALPCVHVHCLEVLREACPNIAAGHWLLSKVLCHNCQGPGDEVSN